MVEKTSTRKIQTSKYYRKITQLQLCVSGCNNYLKFMLASNIKYNTLMYLRLLQASSSEGLLCLYQHRRIYLNDTVHKKKTKKTNPTKPSKFMQVSSSSS